MILDRPELLQSLKILESHRAVPGLGVPGGPRREYRVPRIRALFTARMNLDAPFGATATENKTATTAWGLH